MLAKVFLVQLPCIIMKGQVTVLETILLVLLGIALVGSIFVSLTRISTTSLSTTEQIVIYPEIPPQILNLNCYNRSYGEAFIETDSLVGDVRYRVSNLNGTLVTDGVVTLNISEYGRFNFTADMELDGRYLVKFYIPKWSISETCIAKS